MIIKLAEHYGFCFGVRDALAQAETLAEKGSLTVLGELVHNPIVRARLADRGVHESPLDDISLVPSARVMITAHGASDAARAAWTKAGHVVADGTCPLVRHAHAQLQRLVRDGYFPVVIGKAGHVEVRGLIGDFPEAQVVETAADIAGLPPRLRYGVISQTTQPLEKAQALVAAIRAAHPESEVRFCDTICKPTKERQSALQKLLAEVEAVVVVGGRHSNNTRELVRSVEAAGRIAFHIETPDDLRSEWFDQIERVGLTAGTSTLRETVAAVHARLLTFHSNASTQSPI